MINGDAFKLAFGERKFLIFHPYPEILAINHFYTMTLHKKELSALENHHTSSIPQGVVSVLTSAVCWENHCLAPVLVQLHLKWIRGDTLGITFVK